MNTDKNTIALCIAGGGGSNRIHHLLQHVSILIVHSTTLRLGIAFVLVFAVFVLATALMLTF